MHHNVNKIQIVISVKKNEKEITELLILRTNEKRGQFWQNITGKIEKGESPIDAAHRELFEETGLKNKTIYDINYSFVFEKNGTSLKEQVFLCILDQKEDIKIDPKEHNALKWVKMDEIAENTFGFHSSYDSFIKAREYAKEKKLPL